MSSCTNICVVAFVLSIMSVVDDVGYKCCLSSCVIMLSSGSVLMCLFNYL